MKKIVCVISFAFFAGIVYWSAIPSSHQISDYMGPGPKSIIQQPVATNMGPDPMGISVLNSTIV